MNGGLGSRRSVSSVGLIDHLVRECDHARDENIWLVAQFEAMARVAAAAVERLIAVGDLDGLSFVRAVAEEHLS